MVERIRLKPKLKGVGYGRPPEGSQFKPGSSGNPRGRPKGSRSVREIIQAITQQKIAVTEKGKTRRIPALEVIFRKLLNEAMRGDPRATKLMLALVDRYSESPEGAARLNDMLAEDREILAQYLKESQTTEPGEE